MENIVITSGNAYTEIDTLASALAYKELLSKEERNSTVVLVGHPNQSITEKIKSWGLPYTTTPPRGDANIVVVDVSEPDHIAEFVIQGKIVEIYDHHAGFENYWENRLGNKAKIEIIGACATLIWEEYKNRGFAKDISTLTANLLSTAIISNSLNFNASVTDKRDRQAYNELAKYTDLPENWLTIYYQDQEKGIYIDPKTAIINDTKVQQVNNLELVIGQLELWDSKKFLSKYLEEAKSALKCFGKPNWFLTSPSISEGKNYLYTEDEKVKQLLIKTINAKFDNNHGETNELWLRKEILREIQNLPPEAGKNAAALDSDLIQAEQIDRKNLSKVKKELTRARETLYPPYSKPF
ncbi:DHH family phosphoesterase [Patescibacteria group bacterium]|nr:DHH family phosphoesterase [Patescibacteria group bacterium]